MESNFVIKPLVTIIIVHKVNEDEFAFIPGIRNSHILNPNALRGDTKILNTKAGNLYTTLLIIKFRDMFNILYACNYHLPLYLFHKLELSSIFCPNEPPTKFWPAGPFWPAQNVRKTSSITLSLLFLNHKIKFILNSINFNWYHFKVTTPQNLNFSEKVCLTVTS